MTLVKDVDRNSLQLVEVYDGNVWSPLCVHNWTQADVTVVCTELEYNGAYMHNLFSRVPILLHVDQMDDSYVYSYKLCHCYTPM